MATRHICFKCRQVHTVDAVDYYWRDYIGHVPQDAIPGGRDLNGKTTYIGQAFLKNVGILTGSITHGDRYISLPHKGKAIRTNVGSKILCTNNINQFRWENADAASLHMTSIGKHLVVGGCEHDQNANIGKITYQGQQVVGKVNSFRIGKAMMYFAYSNLEFSTSTYQVLVFEHQCNHKC